MSRVKAVKADAAPLRVGVVGVGVMGYNHARVLAEMPGVSLVGVADPDDKQADFVERSLGFDRALRKQVADALKEQHQPLETL